MIGVSYSLLLGCSNGGPFESDKASDIFPQEETFSEAGWPKGGNVVLLFMDDVGIDKLSAYNAHPDPASTPVMDSLARNGIVFTKAYSNPTCSPSRASLLTGRHAARTGIGRWIFPPTEQFDLQLYEQLIPERLTESPYSYSSSVAGKWHLMSFARSHPGLHPLEQGFDHHAGSLANPRMAFQAEPEDYPLTYWNWEKSTDGDLAMTDVYMTTDAVDEAISFMQQMEPPWFLYVPFNAAHEPLHLPPAELLQSELSAEATDIERYNALVEAMDTEIGRLIDNIPAEQRHQTTIFLIGDNGTPSFAIAEPADATRSKGSVYEGGVRVPFIVQGQMVQNPGHQVEALVHLVDVFATILDFADVDLESTFTDGAWTGQEVTIDGRSLLPWLQGEQPVWREVLYTEGFYPNGSGPYEYHRKMLRDSQWKIIRNYTQGGAYEEGFYFYGEDDFHEGENLLLEELSDESQSAYSRLVSIFETAELDLGFGP